MVLLWTSVVALGFVGPAAIAQTLNNELEIVQPKKDEGKTHAIFAASRFYLLGGSALDGVSTSLVMGHPKMAYRADGSPLASYQGIETGWARSFGSKNTFAAVGANVALDAGVGFAASKLYQKGGRWRYLAIGLNVLKGTDGLIAGIRNFRFASSVDRRVRLVTGYAGPVTWSH